MVTNDDIQIFVEDMSVDNLKRIVDCCYYKGTCDCCPLFGTGIPPRCRPYIDAVIRRYIALLEKENGELKNTAKEAITLPVNVGEKCYWIVRHSNPPFIQEAVVEEYKVINRLNIYAMTSQGTIDIHYNPLYHTREEAEAKLNEIRRKW